MKIPFYNIVDNEWCVRDEFIEYNVKALNGTDSVSFFNKLTIDLKKYIIYKEFKLLWEYAFCPTDEQVEKLRLYHQGQKIEGEKSHPSHKPLLIVFVSADVSSVIVGPDDNDTYFKDRFNAASGYYSTPTLKSYLFSDLSKLKKSFGLHEVYIPTHERVTLDFFVEQYELNSLDVLKAEFKDNIFFTRLTTWEADFTFPKFMYTDALDISTKAITPLTLQSVLHPDFPIKFTGLMSTLIRLENRFDLKRISFMSQLNIKYYAAVYCSIIDDVYVGDTQGPILRIINLSTSNTQEVVTFYENPHYIKCNKSVISTINIKILDLGNKKKFIQNLSFFFVNILNKQKVIRFNLRTDLLFLL
jgi:hypothetical protein